MAFSCWRVFMLFPSCHCRCPHCAGGGGGTRAAPVPPEPGCVWTGLSWGLGSSSGNEPMPIPAGKGTGSPFPHLLPRGGSWRGELLSALLLPLSPSPAEPSAAQGSSGAFPWGNPGSTPALRFRAGSFQEQQKRAAARTDISALV